MILAAVAPSSSSASSLVLIPVILILIAAYWVPTIVAAIRRDQIPNVGSIVVINLFAGWTVVGWVIALAMAVRSRPQQPAYVVPPGWMPPTGPAGWTPPDGPQGPAGPPQWPAGPQS